MAANPDGPADHEVIAIELARPGGKAFGVLFNYSCHSRSLRSPNRLVSGDVMGIAEQHVEGARPEVIAASFPGASADIDPVVLADGFAPAADGGPAPTVRQGRRLGEDVLEALQNPRPLPVSGGIRTAMRRVMLPAKAPGAAARPIEIVAAAVGTVALVGVDCEAAAEVGLAVKAASPFEDTVVLGICNGWAGYLPVAHQYREGGYEVARTGFGPAAADLLVKEAVALLGSLR
jgi:hypothetical protein